MSEIKFPHQEVIETLDLKNKKFGKENDERIKALNDFIAQGDLNHEEMMDALNESKLIAAMLIKRFDTISKEDEDTYQEEKKKIEEVKKIVQDSVDDIKEEIQKLKDSDDVPPPSMSKEEKINSIVEFIKDNGSISENDLIEFGMKNINGADEIILVPEKLKLIKNEDGNYILKENKGGLLGWALVGFSVLIGAFFGIRYLKNR